VEYLYNHEDDILENVLYLEITALIHNNIALDIRLDWFYSLHAFNIMKDTLQGEICITKASDIMTKI